MPYCCPAKVNLFLSVDGKLPDGYHAISTCMQRIGLCDELEASARNDGSFTLKRDVPATLDASDDLVMKAARLLKEHAGREELGADIILKKRIPTGAGLGGGSSDAAGALRLLGKIWALELGEGDYLELASKLGSDVPFFLGPPAAWCTGRGEKTKPLVPAELFLLLIKPPRSLSTPAVYARYDDLERGKNDPAAFLAAYARGDWKAVGENLHNALTEPALELEPDIGRVMALLRERTPFVSMSGSGSAVFGLFSSLAAAGAAGADIKASHPELAVCAAKTLTE